VLPAASAASTAAAVTTAAVAAAVTTTAVAATPVLARLGLVDREGAALQLLAVHCADRRLRLGRIRHLDEAESASPAGVTVGGNARRGDCAETGEGRFEVALCGVVTQVADVNVQFDLSFISPGGRSQIPTTKFRTVNESRRESMESRTNRRSLGSHSVGNLD